MAGHFIKLGRKRHAKRIAEERDRFDDDGKPRKSDPKRTAPGVPSNLTKYRFKGDLYTAAEEADELRRIRDGDKQALDRFAKHFQPLIRKILGDRNESYRGLSKEEARKRIHQKKAYYGLSEEERIGVGNLGLARFIVEYDLKRNVRFATGLEEYIRGTFLDLMKGTTKPIAPYLPIRALRRPKSSSSSPATRPSHPRNWPTHLITQRPPYSNETPPRAPVIMTLSRKGHLTATT
jgi:hypothetical protein